MKDSRLLFVITKISTLLVALSMLLSGCSSINLPKLNQKPAPVVTSKVSTPAPISSASKSPAQDIQPAKTKPSPSPSDLVVAEGAGGLLKAMNILHANEKNRLGSDNIGYYMDVLFASLQQKLAGINISASRREQDIKITIPGSLIFDSNSAQLNTFSQQPLLLISDVLTEYYKTLVIVEGHADIQGDANYNLSLSKKRALAVGRYLLANQITQQRLFLMGLGSSLPISSNQSHEGRAANRRIELIIKPVLE